MKISEFEIQLTVGGNMRLLSSIFTRATLMVIVTTSQSYAGEENTDLCNLFLPNDFITAQYEMTLGPGTMRITDSELPGPITVPYPKVHKMPATILDVDGTLVLFAEKGFNMELVDIEFDERDWVFTKGGPFQMAVSPEDAALLMGCKDVNELPRLAAKGVGSYFSDDGTEVPSFAKLFVTSISDNTGISAFGGFRAIGPNIVFSLRFSLRPL